ncbi:putative membrane protein YfcA [Neobacillus niacini]|nr:putative membrane protein YfcA [Neobacillus niacini]
MTILQWILTVTSGGIIGFTLGLIGGGGSILAVPLLLYMVGVKDPHIVIGSTALAVSINAFLNLIPHSRAGHVHWRPAIVFAIPGVVGAFCGSYLGKLLQSKQLLFLFALLMIFMAIKMILPKKTVKQLANTETEGIS